MIQMFKPMLYPRNNPLKDIILRSKKNGYNSLIVKEWSVYGVPADTLAFSEDSVEKRLYNAITEYYYYADVEADDDTMFMQRFTALWNIYTPEYSKVLKELVGYTGDKETLVIEGVNSREGGKSNTIEDTETLNETDDETRVMKKGVSTTSSQENANEGNKLTRSTPNEQMSVSGSAQTTVTDSGQDEDNYNRETVHSKNKNQTDTGTYNETLNVDTTNNRSKLTAEIIAKLSEFNGIVMEFVFKFENLFMGVL